MQRNPLLARFASVASMVAPEKQELFETCLREAAANEHLQKMLATVATDDDFWPEADSWIARYRPYIVVNGILQIPVKGVLLHDFPYQLGSWATGYEYIWRAFERGLADDNVKGIALIENSPGGEVAGNFELVDRMFAHRGEKPVRAYAAEFAYSAAYSIASVADSITVSRTGGVGSIGVLTAHVDVSNAMEKEGVKITFIFAGKHKVDGNPYEALPDAVKMRIQKRIDSLYSIFVSTVARNRSMSEKAIRDTEALTFTAAEAVSNGLADSIGALDDALAVFAADLSPNPGDEDMSDKKDESATAQAAAVETARAEGVTEGTKTGVVTGTAAGAKAERARVVAIIGSDEGKKRPKAALAVALESDMTAEQASAFLAKLGEEKAETAPAKSGGDFSEAMKKDNPDLGGSGGDKTQQTDVQRILADQDSVIGRTRAKVAA